MGQWFPIILVIAFALWQVIAQIAQHAERKQQQERMRKAAEERRRQQSGGEPPRPAPVRGGGEAASPQSRARIEDLAARRKAQLEELRRRRAQPGPSPQVRAGPQTSPPPPAPPMPAAPGRRATAPAKRYDSRAARVTEEAERRRREQEAERQRQLQERRARESQAEERRKEAERRARREGAKVQRQLQARTVSIAPGVVDAYALHQDGSGRGARIKALLRNKLTLRDVFLLKEVLEPPRSIAPYEDPLRL